jgi:hypothetical protein
MNTLEQELSTRELTLGDGPRDRKYWAAGPCSLRQPAAEPSGRRGGRVRFSRVRLAWIERPAANFFGLATVVSSWQLLFRVPTLLNFFRQHFDRGAI